MTKWKKNIKDKELWKFVLDSPAPILFFGLSGIVLFILTNNPSFGIIGICLGVLGIIVGKMMITGYKDKTK